MSAILALELTSWHPTLSPEAQQQAARAIEDGTVIVLPQVGFVLRESERRFLSPIWSDGSRKNISLEGESLRAAMGSAADRAELAAMIGRFATEASALVTALFPRYAPYVKRARTSFRPQPAVGRDVSWRKDDARLHIDAFPSRPTGGERILRVFSNINPAEDRVWRVGEPFEAMARTFLPSIRRPLPGSAALLSALFVTKRRRSEYDHLMLQLHDRAKARHELPTRLCARDRALRSGHDMAVLFRPGHARRVFRSVHARTDDSPAGLGAVRARAIAPRHTRAPHRPRAGTGALIFSAMHIPGRAPWRWCMHRHSS